jgi:xylulokinase
VTSSSWRSTASAASATRWSPCDVAPRGDRRRHRHVEQQSIGASYGAAFLAAQLVGPASIDDWNPVQETVTPRPEVAAQYEELYRLYRDLYPQTADTVHALAARQAR